MTKLPAMTHPDSRFLLAAALILSVSPAFGATPKKAAKPVPKTAKAAKVEEAPADPAGALIAQSRAALLQGDKDLAVRMAQSAIVAAPARTDTYVALGDVYAAGGEAEYAREYYEQALNIDPSDAGALKAVAGLDRAPQQRTATRNRQAPGTP